MLPRFKLTVEPIVPPTKAWFCISHIILQSAGLESLCCGARLIFDDGFRRGGRHLAQAGVPAALQNRHRQGGERSGIGNIKTKASGLSQGPFSCLNLAGAAGFEPATTGFGDQRSGQTELRSYDV